MASTPAIDNRVQPISTALAQLNLGQSASVGGSSIGGESNTNTINNIHSFYTLPTSTPQGSSLSSRNAQSGVIHQNNSESASDTYARILLAKRIGYPIWDPRPPNNPRGYRQEGVRIGDVGIVTFEGRFQFLFNVCLPVDDPINRRAPPSMEPFVFDGNDDTETNSDAFHRGCVISSSSIQRKRLDSEIELQRHSDSGSAFHFTCSPNEGAVLILPNGASKTDLCFRQNIQDYARRHVISWYEHLYNTVGLEVDVGPLYLVTGYHKCENWCVASYSNAPIETEMSLSFDPTSTTAGRVLYSSWNSGNIDARTCRPEQDCLPNQCVYIRGYKMTLCKSLIEKIFLGRAKITHVVPPNGYCEGEGGVRANTGVGTLWQWFPWFIGGNQHQGNQHRLGEARAFTTSDSVAVEGFPDLSGSYHPSDVINSYLLGAHPDAHAAMIHDDVWCNIIGEEENRVPDGPELIRRVMETYRVVQEAGCVFLVPKDESINERAPIHIQQAAQTVPANGKKKALLIGINYYKNKGESPLCVLHRDVIELKKLLIETYGYEENDIVVMMDGGDDSLEPNQENILREIQNLVKDAKSGDHFLFYYSGHSGQIINEDNAEEDGLDEVLIPSDDKNFDKMIMDDQLRKYLVDALPRGSSLVAIIDCCHSGSMLDLKHHRCNRVFTPWVSDGHRRWTDLKRDGTVRRQAVVTSRHSSLHIYENQRLDHNTVKSKKTSLEFEPLSRQVSIKSRSLSLPAQFDSPESRQVSVASSLTSEVFQDAPESPIEEKPSTWLPQLNSSDSPLHSGIDSPSPVELCASPVEEFCSGFCFPTPEDKPYVVCVAACDDSQLSWEDDKGRSMTMGMIGFLRENPQPRLDQLMQHISHYVYDLAAASHQALRRLKRRVKESKSSGDHALWAEFTEAGYDLEQYQDPQLSSHSPLDMNAIFTL